MPSGMQWGNSACSAWRSSRVQIAVRLGVEGRQVPHMEVGAGGVRADGAAADIGAGVEGAVLQGHDLQQLGADHRPVDLVAGLDVRGDGGLVLVQGVVVVQNGGGDDGGVGEVPLVQTQLIEAAHHAVGLHAPELAFFDVLPAGEGGLVEGHRHQIPRVDVPGAGDDLHRLSLAHIHLAHPHVVGVRVALHGEDLSRHNIGDLGPPVLGGLHLGPGEGHGLGKIFIRGVHRDELLEPFAR